ncbi:MAG: polymerase delta subunit [Actinomycetia bacterium]|jgi:DNA polymerase-3 subunit delta|nr:polymerase delta subunit [Actinomycetes bacterium]
MVQGADPSLRDREVQRLIDELLAGEDRSFALDDHTLASRRRVGDATPDTEPDDEARAAEGSTELPAFAALTTALQSPPFMTSARVVVVRDIGNATTEQAQWLAAWIADPLDGVHLVLVAGGGRVSSALDKAIKANAQLVGPAGDQTADVLQRELRDAHLKLAPDAAKQVAAHLGEDAGRVPELVDLLHSTYGANVTLTLDEVEQYLGEVGTAGRFDLANFIDRGDVGSALETLHRMLTSSSAAQPKPLHPMQIMASLAFHYQRLLRLDDPSIVTKEHAATALGMKSPGGARFPLEASRRLGTDGLRDAIRLLARAELDLRGAGGLDDRTVIEVLVARLAGLSRRSARR